MEMTINNKPNTITTTITETRSQTKTMNPEKWVFNLLLPFLFIRFCTSIDTLTPTQFIKGGDVLVSSGETFALGFFSLGNSSRRYVGIWYYKISEQTVVWVANRDRPINGTSGVLSLNRDGNLVIYDNTRNSTVWHTNVSAVSYSARLLDSGNLVLCQGDSGSGGVVWQSFDHPTNTLLPNMKLGLDRRTGLEWFLTSWKSRDDPGTGEYSYRVEPNELPQLIGFKGSTRLWRIPLLLKPSRNDEAKTTASSILNATYVNNRDQVYSFYTPINASTLLTMFVDEFGSLKLLTWVGKWVEFYSIPGDQCVAYGRCGAYGYCDSNNRQDFECTCLPGYEPSSAEKWYLRDASGGCIKERKALSMCGNGEGFVKVEDAIIPDTSKARLLMSLSMNECKDECLRNCSCLAYASEAEGGERANCITWYENLMDVRKFVRRFPEGRLDLYVRVDVVELAQRMKSRRINQKKVVVVVTSVVLTSVLLIILVCWLVMKKRRRGKDIQDSDEENIELPIFDMVTIVGATNNFSDKNKIGQGGFGSVYKGHLSTGKDIAVKRLSRDSKQGLKEFKNEVTLIAKLQHRNLVRLLGCCILREERMLVYEYMPNGSLDSFIFDITQRKLLTWSRRLAIIIGIARGILYLHQDSRLRVIHRDLKASNVLLDSEMNPKISDFGLARAFGGDQSSAKTKMVVGTYGYMAPEYAIDGLFSTKSDIFSFGVIVLEIMSGKMNRKFHHTDHDLNLLGHAWKLWIDGKAFELIDPVMEGSFPMSKVLRCIQIGLLCVQKCPEDRPTMSCVVLMLVSDILVLPQPKQPGFYIERSSQEKHECSAAQSPPSINEVTMTHLEAR
ncbi:G-type lectin S-receptor-like serine/threonine-protein kinase RKS1 isoform X3 [Rhododendron vialii]|uniref:G-type lectin S-receptor-like serine/threonine-protein kinase RKS1 isoform X3 n=2 Tax=Rhododendron vialii TaxID=182163 RepID=UPI00266044BD|nr:G-type lectin S-receptor-like serine/threonine-protein kinase RKS1 isoform X3 [Rhododendron vialii]